MQKEIKKINFGIVTGIVKIEHYGECIIKRQNPLFREYLLGQIEARGWNDVTYPEYVNLVLEMLWNGATNESDISDTLFDGNRKKVSRALGFLHAKRNVNTNGIDKMENVPRRY